MNENEREKIELSIQTLKEQVMYFNAHRENLVKVLEKRGYLEDYNMRERNFSRNSIEKLIEESQREDGATKEDLEQLYEYIFRLRDLAEQAETFVENETLIHEFSIKRQWENYWREQRKDFLTWAHRLFRWGVGASIAILIYSAGAWLSEGRGDARFFHMPIHDWLGKPPNK